MLISARSAVEKTFERLGFELPQLPELWSPINKPQEMAITTLADELFFGGSAGGGKALALDTQILTDKGYRRIGDLCIGDQVYGRDGKLYSVMATSPTMYDHRVFEVEFDDGSIIKADADHRWLTFTDKDRTAIQKRDPEQRAKRRAMRPSRSTGKKPWLAERNAARAEGYMSEPVTGGVRTTLEILETLKVRNGARTNHAIPVCDPIESPERILPVNPYILGYWLGDGTAHGQYFTIGDNYRDEAISIFKERGYDLIKCDWVTKYQYKVLGLGRILKSLGLKDNKHIPDDYMRSSVEQRKELLRGLMDTDGYAAKNGLCEFYSSVRSLIEQVSELLSSLGIKNVINAKKPPPNSTYNESYRIKFAAPFPVFHFIQKRERQNLDLRETQRYRYIVGVREIPSEPVKCIAIDAPDHLYLAGKSNIPTHNTMLIIGLAIKYHLNSIIFRREHTQIKGIETAVYELLTHTAAHYNKKDHIWTGIPGGRVLEFGGVPNESNVSRYQGRPHDLIAFDEITSFTRNQYVILKGWNRTGDLRQRNRIVATGNPPLDEEGEWVLDYWEPWLNPEYPNPAADGELRYFLEIDGVDTEMKGPGRVRHNGEILEPRSRTFIRASVEDNPVYMAQGYNKVLESMPEPYRSKLRYGLFYVKTEDDPFQVIPTRWITLAQSRWHPDRRFDHPLTGAGLDIAVGGKDNTALALLYNTFFDEIIKIPGVRTSTPDELIVRIKEFLPKTVPVQVDAVSWGNGHFQAMRKEGFKATPVNVGAASFGTDLSKQIRFANLRAELFWKFREALDPNVPSGSEYALPPDRDVLIELSSIRYKRVREKIQIEEKSEIRKRLGHSPDLADSIVLAFRNKLPRSAARNWNGKLSK